MTVADVAPSYSYQPAHSARRTHAFKPRGEPTCPMSTIKPESCTEYNQRLARELPMPLIQWKALKGVLYSGIAVTASVALSAVDASWMQIAVCLLTILVIFGVEFDELRVAQLVTLKGLQTSSSEDDDE